jgi:hypothetical protein
MTNVNFTAIEVDRSDQPVFIARNVKNDPMIQFIGSREGLPQFGKVIEFGPLHDLEPMQQRRPAFRMLFPKLDRCLTGDNVHAGEHISN